MPTVNTSPLSSLSSKPPSLQPPPQCAMLPLFSLSESHEDDDDVDNDDGIGTLLNRTGEVSPGSVALFGLALPGTGLGPPLSPGSVALFGLALPGTVGLGPPLSPFGVLALVENCLCSFSNPFGVLFSD
jgi:hypothetical protein